MHIPGSRGENILSVYRSFKPLSDPWMLLVQYLSSVYETRELSNIHYPVCASSAARAPARRGEPFAGCGASTKVCSCNYRGTRVYSSPGTAALPLKQPAGYVLNLPRQQHGQTMEAG